MSVRRLVVIGLVILLAIAIGALARCAMEQPSQQASAPATPAPVETPAPSTSSPSANAEAPAPHSPAESVSESNATEPAASGAQKAAPAADSVAQPGFDVVRVEPDGSAIIAGRAAPNTEVQLLANGAVIASATTNAAGEFVIMPSQLAAGSHELSLKVGEQISQQAVTVSVPQPGQGEVLVVVGEPGKPSQIVQSGAPDSPTAGVLAQVPELVGEAADEATPLRIGAVESEGGRLFVQGSGPPGGKVIIYLNDAPVAEAEIAQNGRWSLTVESGVSGGGYTVRVDQIGADGAVSARVEVPFKVDGSETVASDTAPATSSGSGETAQSPAEPTSSTTAAAQPDSAASARQEASATEPSAASDTANPVVSKVGTITVRRGDSLWRISRQIYGQGVRYSSIYDANTDQIRDPNKIYPGQVFVTPDR